MEKNLKKNIYTHMYNGITLHKKLIKHCKSTVLQLKKSAWRKC